MAKKEARPHELRGFFFMRGVLYGQTCPIEILLVGSQGDIRFWRKIIDIALELVCRRCRASIYVAFRQASSFSEARQRLDDFPETAIIVSRFFVKALGDEGGQIKVDDFIQRLFISWVKSNPPYLFFIEKLGEAHSQAIEEEWPVLAYDGVNNARIFDTLEDGYLKELSNRLTMAILKQFGRVFVPGTWVPSSRRKP